LHVFNDHLWLCGEKKAPNEGFTMLKDRVCPIVAINEEREEVPSDWEQIADQVDNIRLENDDTQNDQAVSSDPPNGAAVQVDQNDRTNNPEQPAEAANEASDAEKDNKGTINNGSKSSRVDVALMDAALERALLIALKEFINDHSLPLTPSQLFDQMSFCHTDQSFKLDMKHSNYKKLTKMLKHYCQKGLLTTKQMSISLRDKAMKEHTITQINRSHPLLTSFTVNTLDLTAIENRARQKDLQREQNANDESDNSIRQSVRVLLKYCPSKSIAASGILVNMPSKQLVNMNDLKNLFSEWIIAHNLSGKNGQVKLDEALKISLFQNDDKQVGDVVSQQSITKKIEKNAILYHAIVFDDKEPSDEPYRKGPVPLVEINVKQIQGRKFQTSCSGLEQFGVEVNSNLTKLFSQKFAASATTADIPGSEKLKRPKKELLIQGNVDRELAELLERQFSIPKQYITLSNSKGGKK